MRTLRLRTGGVAEDNSTSSKGCGLKKIELISEDELVSRRITRSMRSKSKSSGKEAGNGTMEAGDESGNDTDDGVDKLQGKRIAKRKRIEAAVTDTEGKVLTFVKTRTLATASIIDKGKGLELGCASMEGSKVTTAGAVITLSDDDNEYDKDLAKAVVGALGARDSDGKGDEDGVDRGFDMRRNKNTIDSEVKGTKVNRGTSRTRRLKGHGRQVKKNSDVLPVNLSDTASSSSEGNTESLNAAESDSDFADEDHQRSTIRRQQRSRRIRQASPEIVPHQEDPQVALAAGPSETGRGAASRKRALDIARSRAAHFAHFNSQDEDNRVNAAAIPSPVEQVEHVRRVGELLAQAQAAVAGNESRGGDREDWPGPWAVARRLVEGRFAAAAARQDAASQGINRTQLVDWSPSRTAQFCQSKLPPSLHRKCLEVLCKNIDHVESLDGVPDGDKKWLVNGLCALKKLTPAVLRVCISVSPAEIVIPDCTCLTEEDVTNTLSSCSVERLVALELTMCGRGITDHCLATVCAEKGNQFPELQTLALRGAYRLVDQGISRILNAATKLKTVDLTLCSLISESSVEAIADTLGPTLESLVLDGCTQLNGLKLLPALLKMVNLQRLSLSGIPGVSDGVISELLVKLRFNLKELELRACQGLTDAGIQAVSLCQDLRLLDLGHLPSLTDIAMGLIGDNCRNLRTLRLCRGKFSDTALAAFVSASGSCLIELSLNSTRLVGDHTMMALAQFSKGTLETLDVSWCRLISDQALGLLADSCCKLSSLKLFGCTQVTNLFLEGHSNELLNVRGIWDSPTVTGSTS